MNNVSKKTMLSISVMALLACNTARPNVVSAMQANPARVAQVGLLGFSAVRSVEVFRKRYTTDAARESLFSLWIVVALEAYQQRVAVRSFINKTKKELFG